MISAPKILHKESPSNHHTIGLKGKEGKIPRSGFFFDTLVSISI